MNNILSSREADESLTDLSDKIAEKKAKEKKRISPKKKVGKKNLKEEDPDKRSDFEKVASCQNLQEALKKYGKFHTAQGVVTMWNSKEIVKPALSKEEEDQCDPELELRYKWQEDLWARLLDIKWDHRRLLWVVDPIGGKGKSTFCRCFKHHHDAIVLKTATGASNIANLLESEIEAGNKIKYILIDLPRATTGHKMWDTIECLLDGIITALKYKSKSLQLTIRPRVVVFSNWDPPFHPYKDENGDWQVKKEEGREKDRENCNISKDRWNIHDVKSSWSTIDVDGVKTKRWDFKLKARENGFFDPDFDKKKPVAKLKFQKRETMTK